MRHKSIIKTSPLCLVMCLFLVGYSPPGLSEPTGPVTNTRPLARIVIQPTEDLTSEAFATVRALKQAQVRLRENNQSLPPSNGGIYFALQMGAPAAYEATNLSPRRVFLDFNFDRPYSARRTRTLAGNKAIRLEYAPTEASTLVWDVTVELSSWSNELQSVILYNRPPHITHSLPPAAPSPAK